MKICLRVILTSFFYKGEREREREREFEFTLGNGCIIAVVALILRK